MKKILRYMTTLAVAGLLAGCAQVEESAEPKGSGVQTSDVVGFDVYTQRSTRSGTTGDVTTDNLKAGTHSADGFGVFAYYTGEDNYSLEFKPNFMYNQQVKYNSSASKFTYEPQKYWPNEENHHVSFFAYAPWVNTTASTGAAADQTYGITGMTKNTATGDPLIHYVATTDLSKGVDLCWNRQLDQTKSSSAVNFTLAHALSKLNVQVQTSIPLNANTKIYIRSITFSGFTMKGSLNLNSATAQWTAYEKGGPLNKDAVTFYDGRRDGREGYVADDSELPAGINPDLVQSTLWDDFSPKPGVTNSAQNLFTSATATDPAYVIPTGDPVDITIEYDIETADPKLQGYFLSDGKTNGTSIANRITKPNVLTSLDAGKSYTINLNLGLTDVTFDATEVKNWKSDDPELVPLTFEAMEAGVQVRFDTSNAKTANNTTAATVLYSTDEGETWDNYVSNTTVTLANVGDKVSFMSMDGTKYWSGSLYTPQPLYTLNNKRCYIYGNILSLVNYSKTLPSNTNLRFLFYKCSTIYNHPSKKIYLPATTLSSNCYYCMFYGCSNLTEAPLLPATNLAPYCYSVMFRGCTSLVNAPTLPATTIPYNSYASMFMECTSLTTAPDLPATEIGSECYNNMFFGCTSLTTAPAELPATTLDTNCYWGMFQNCTNLTTAPNLPATTLATSCYGQMFSGCTSLTSVQLILPSTELTEDCYYNMFHNCSSLTSAPTLPATTLAVKCYRQMFMGCTNLTSIRCLATDISASSCLSNWLSQVASSGTFTKASSMDSWPTGDSGIPSGWTVQDAP